MVYTAQFCILKSFVAVVVAIAVELPSKPLKLEHQTQLQLLDGGGYDYYCYH